MSDGAPRSGIGVRIQWRVPQQRRDSLGCTNPNMISADRLIASSWTRRVVWVATIVLCAIAILGAVGRTVEVTSGPSALKVSAGDQLRLKGLTALLGAQPNSNAYREAERQVAAITARFNAYPGTTLLHILPGLVVLTLGPLQFLAPLRARFPRLHRWTGRVLLTAAVPVGLSGLFFGVLVPYAGLSETLPSAIFGGLFLLAIAQAFRAIRRRDMRRHREWVLRLFALAMGVGTIRLVGVGLVALGEVEVPRIVGVSFWLGWLATLGAAEWWIRATRPRQSTLPPPSRNETVHAT